MGTWTPNSIMNSIPSHPPQLCLRAILVRHLFAGQRKIELLCTVGPTKSVARKLP